MGDPVGTIYQGNGKAGPQTTPKKQISGIITIQVDIPEGIIQREYFAIIL